jgi:hypothetical protein
VRPVACLGGVPGNRVGTRCGSAEERAVKIEDYGGDATYAIT